MCCVCVKVFAYACAFEYVSVYITLSLICDTILLECCFLLFSNDYLHLRVCIFKIFGGFGPAGVVGIFLNNFFLTGVNLEHSKRKSSVSTAVVWHCWQNIFVQLWFLVSSGFYWQAVCPVFVLCLLCHVSVTLLSLFRALKQCILLCVCLFQWVMYLCFCCVIIWLVLIGRLWG